MSQMGSLHLPIPQGYLKFGGWALAIGGLMGFSGQLLHIGDTPASLGDIPDFVETAVNTHVWLAWASILILMGLPAMYLRQAAGLKWWGWIGLPLLFVGMILEIFHGPFQIFSYPIIYSLVSTDEVLNTVNGYVNNLMVDDYPTTLFVLIPLMPGLFLGLILLGISTIKAKALHRGLGIFVLVVIGLLIAGMFMPEDVNTFSTVHLIFVAFGVVLLREKKAEASVSTGAAA
ncbi:hypothetical protein ACFPPD_18840 [Cohnella suwonensis]|uniref:DUF998 domain-containing protein n=1 Tax=Cohnella suwonensis TaxID=696072 RepID=A0ABW0LYD5_9BACL